MAKFIIRDRITGVITLDLSRRVVKLLGTMTTVAGSAGNITVAGNGDGDVWFSAIPATDGAGGNTPSVTLSGRIISWTAAAATVTITYGIY